MTVSQARDRNLIPGACPKRRRRAAPIAALCAAVLVASGLPAMAQEEGQGDGLILNDPYSTGDRGAPLEGPIVLRAADGSVRYERQGQVTFPAFPLRENLIRIRAPTHAAGREYYVDSKSVALGQDRLIRYTVVVRSSGGVNNVIHESMNCSERNVRVLGHGTASGRFRESVGSNWRRYSNSGPMAYRAILAVYYLCGESHEPLDADRIVARLQSGGEEIENPIYPDRGGGGQGG